MMKAYQAWGNAGKHTAETPKKAAMGYFENYPNSRKCTVVEGVKDGAFFTVVYGRHSEGKWPSSWKDVTKKHAHGLPDTEVQP